MARNWTKTLLVPALLAGLPAAVFAFERDEIIAAWEQYQTICGAALGDLTTTHEDPASVYDAGFADAYEWLTNADHSLSWVGIFAETPSGGFMTSSVETYRADAGISHYCAVDFLEMRPDDLRPVEDTKALFAELGFKLNGGEILEFNDPDAPLGELGFTFGGAFPDRPSITSLSISEGGLTLEHSVFEAAQ